MCSHKQAIYRLKASILFKLTNSLLFSFSYVDVTYCLFCELLEINSLQLFMVRTGLNTDNMKFHIKTLSFTSTVYYQCISPVISLKSYTIPLYTKSCHTQFYELKFYSLNSLHRLKLKLRKKHRFKKICPHSL